MSFALMNDDAFHAGLFKHIPLQSIGAFSPFPPAVEELIRRDSCVQDRPFSIGLIIDPLGQIVRPPVIGVDL